MGVGPGTVRRPLDVGSARLERSGTIREERLRVVMVVANDVTHDSRVLREAGVLAASGHRVTVLGIMTARTVAPEVELRDGFVIRRLRYRARPPGWWIPPDFYARIRYRANRQYRIHRARLFSLGRRARRELLRRRVGLRDRGASSGAGLELMRWTASRAKRLNAAVRKRVDRSAAAVRRFDRRAHRAADRARRLARRARRAPRSAWSRKVRGAMATAGIRARSAMLSRRSLLATWSSARPRRVRVDATPWHTGQRRMLISRSAARMTWSRVLQRTIAPALRTLRAIGRGLRAWAGIVALLMWGSIYLLANRLTRGALEWQTGWRWRWLGWAEYIAKHAPDADVWHGHDMTSLPAIVELKRRRGGYAVYDSHEVYLESGRHAAQPRWAKAPLEALERRLVAEVDAVITVNESLAGILARRLGSPGVHVLYNCPPRTTPSTYAPLRRALSLADTVPLLVYHGSLTPHRGLEQLLEAIARPELRDAHLAFMGFGALMGWLRAEAGNARYSGRVHVLDAVAPERLTDWLRGVDVAVAPIQDSTLNHRYSSPNKVFEAIAAGTPVAGSDFPEFRRVINDPHFGPLGALFDPSRPEDIARAVRGILDADPAERAALRRRCLEASRLRWNWETECRSLMTLYDGFASDRAAALLRGGSVVGAA